MNPPSNLDTNWDYLNFLIQDVLDEQVDLLSFKILIGTLEHDEYNGSGVLLGFKRAPAAKGNHHAYEGGLVAHLLEMWNLWKKLQPQFLAPPHVTPQRVLKAIILHDLHKAHRTFELVKADPWEVRYCDDPTDMLMTSDIKSIWLAQRAGIELDPEQLNALLWSEGGFSKIRPRWCSVLAKVCYALDELSGNGLARIETRTLLDRTRTETLE